MTNESQRTNYILSNKHAIITAPVLSHLNHNSNVLIETNYFILYFYFLTLTVPSDFTHVISDPVGMSGSLAVIHTMFCYNQFSTSVVFYVKDYL